MYLQPKKNCWTAIRKCRQKNIREETFTVKCFRDEVWVTKPRSLIRCLKGSTVQLQGSRLTFERIRQLMNYTNKHVRRPVETSKSFLLNLLEKNSVHVMVIIHQALLKNFTWSLDHSLRSRLSSSPSAGLMDLLTYVSVNWMTLQKLALKSRSTIKILNFHSLILTSTPRKVTLKSFMPNFDEN